MNSWSQSDRPPVPTGATGGPAGDGREQRAIVPAGGGRPTRSLSAPAGLFFCALGGAVASSSIPAVAPALVAYGCASVFATTRSTPTRAASVFAALVPAVALSVTAGPAAVAGALIACAVAFAVAGAALLGRVTPGFAAVVCALAAFGQMGVDAAVAAAHGTTLGASVSALVDVYASQLGSQGAAMAATMDAVQALMAVMWPTAYVIAALGLYLSGLLGTHLAAAQAKEGVVRPGRLADYDLPLWVVAVLVAAAAGLAFALTTSGDAARVALVVSANVVMALRFALAVQGLAVLSWFLRGRQVGPVASALAWGLALYLETQFVVLSLVGLVDVWANLRHLPRGARTDETDNAGQD